jgi:hypothetical protein
MAIAKLKCYKLPDIDQILAEMIQAGDETLHSGIHRHIDSIRNKEELPQQWKESILYQFTKRAVKETTVITEACHFYQLHTNYFFPSLKAKSICKRN